MLKEGEKIYDVFVAGGGINGLGVARDAAGRGYSAPTKNRGETMVVQKTKLLGASEVANCHVEILSTAKNIAH